MLAESSKTAFETLAALPAGKVVRVVLTGRVDKSRARGLSLKSTDFASPSEVREARIQALRRDGQTWKTDTAARARALGLNARPARTFTNIVVEGAVEGVRDLIKQVQPRSVILDRPLSLIEPVAINGKANQSASG